MRGKRSVGRVLAGILAVALLTTSMPSVAHATAAETGMESAVGLEEATWEEAGQELIGEETLGEEENLGQSNEETGDRKEELEMGQEQDVEDQKEEVSDSGDKVNESENNNAEDQEQDPSEAGDEPGEQNPAEEPVVEEPEMQEKIEPVSVSENNAKTNGKITRTDLVNTFSLKGRNSFGNMLEEALSDKAEEQLESNGYNVFSVEMNGQMAKVSFETLEDAVLIVAIYDEAGKRLLASGSRKVFAEERIVEVEIAETVPQYFHVRSFLTDKDTLQPLCPLYDSPMYTQEMQEFLAKTTEDFDEDRILNLDEDKTNYFAVYNEDAIVIQDKEGVNILVSADEEKYVYVIEDADENVMSLKPGDIFVYEYMEDTVLIVKVASVEVDGTTATITGEKLSMEEVFDYVKVDTEAGLQEAEVDASNLEDGVLYEGITPYLDGVKTPSTSKIHECVACIDGNIVGKIGTKFKAKLFNSDKLSYKAECGTTIHIRDFYYSQDFNEFDWGKCPHYLYKK